MSTNSELARIIEAIIFSARAIVKKEELYKYFSNVKKEEIDRIIESIKIFHHENTSLTLEEVAGGFRFKTKKVYYPYIKEFFGFKKELRFSKAALETLSLIAYKQPITLKEISYYRGTQSSYMLRQLLDSGLIKIAGRKDVPGHPLLYETTDKFLEVFGLKSLEELPSIEELKDILKDE